MKAKAMTVEELIRFLHAHIEPEQTTYDVTVEISKATNPIDVFDVKWDYQWHRLIFDVDPK